MINAQEKQVSLAYTIYCRGWIDQTFMNKIAGSKVSYDLIESLFSLFENNETERHNTLVFIARMVKYERSLK